MNKVDFSLNKRREIWVLNNIEVVDYLERYGFSDIKITENGSYSDLRDKIDFFANYKGTRVPCQLKVRKAYHSNRKKEITIRTTSNDKNAEWNSSKAKYYLGVYLNTRNINKYENASIDHMVLAYVEPIYKAIKGKIPGMLLLKYNLEERERNLHIPIRDEQMYYDLKTIGVCSRMMKDGKTQGVWVDEKDDFFENDSFAIIPEAIESYFKDNIFLN